MEGPACRAAKFASSSLPHFSWLQRGRRVSPTWDTYTYIHTCKTYAHTHTHNWALCLSRCFGRLWSPTCAKRCPFFFTLLCVRARLCVLFWPRRVDVQCEDYSGCRGMPGWDRGGVRVTSCSTLKYKVVHLFLLQRLRCAVMNNRASAEVRSHSVSFLFLYTARYEILYAAGLLTHVRLFL